MTTSEMRMFLKHKSIDKVMFENHITGSKELVNIPGKGLQFVFIPFNGFIFADHKVCVSLPHSVYMGFDIYQKDNGEFIYIFKYVWKAGTGKKMRKDAAWNLYWDMMSETKEMPL